MLLINKNCQPSITPLNAEGKKFVTIAVGCTGGKHRSVAITAEIAKQLNEIGTEISAHPTHRDVGRE